MLNQFFVFLNFGILLALLIYAWIHFGVPYFKAAQKMEQEHAAQRDEQYAQLIHRQHVIEKQILTASIRRERLLLGMKKWAENVRQEKKQRVINAEAQSKKICMHMSKQYTAIQKRCFQKSVLQPATLRAEEDLQRLYHDDKEKARRFVEMVCNQVHKEVL